MAKGGSTYVVFVRGINVSRSSRILMKDFVKMLSSLVFTNIKTYIQSGNAVFNARDATTEQIRNRLQELLYQTFHRKVTATVYTIQHYAQLLMANPFLKDDSVDKGKLHLTFFQDPPSEEAITALNDMVTSPDMLVYNEGVAYLYCPGGYAHCKVSNLQLEKVVKVACTTRNWRTADNVLKLGAKN